MRAKVWNKGPLPLEEMFKGEKVRIEPGKFVEMEFYDAHEFKGQYRPIDKGADGFGTPASFKMVTVEKISEEDAVTDTLPSHKCMSCGKTYESEPVLKAHVESAHASQESLVIPELDQKIEKKKRASKVA